MRRERELVETHQKYAPKIKIEKDWIFVKIK